MGTTPNLSLPYPASTDYIANGYSDIENLALGVDDIYGATTSYTPTTTNVTGGTKTGNYRIDGKWLTFWAQITSGTATAAGTVTISLPAGVTSAGRVQLVNGMKGAAVASAYVNSNSTDVTCHVDAAGNNFALGGSVGTYRIDGRIEIQ